MKSFAIIALLVVSASAWPWDNDYVNDAGTTDDVHKQNDVNRLLHSVSENISPQYEDLVELSKTFQPLANLGMYKDDGEAAKHLDDLLHYHVLEQHHYFSLFNPDHRRDALALLDVLMSCKDYDCFNANACYYRERLNEGVFTYAYYTAITHSELTKHVVLPALYEITPHMFVTSEIINAAYAAQMLGEDKEFYMDFSGSKTNPEQRVSYFGEDVGMNNHHVAWHQSFPFYYDAEKYGQEKIDRKGELFFYMHHQLTARYDAERLSNYLDVVDELDFEDKIVEGFAPHTMYKYGGEFPSRPDNIYYHDVDGVATVRDMLITETRIKDAIAHGYVVDKQGHQVPINDQNGINILGDVIESSHESPNEPYYGSLHNTAHVMLGRQSDPQGKYNMPPGVMEHFETATRDPSFFRLHKYMDNIFKDHKDSLPPYTQEELIFKGVSLEEVTIQGNLKTYFENYTFEIENAVDTKDSAKQPALTVKTTRLNHEEFKFNFEVENNNGDGHFAVFRVFMCPRYDYNHILHTFEDGRDGCFEVDKFVKKLASGHNQITRSSHDSSVTIPDRLHVHDLEERTAKAIANGEVLLPELAEYEQSCGIPNRMLLPKGKSTGMEFVLAVAVTDGDKDIIVPVHDEHRYSHSLCGVEGNKYPDMRPMGYPLDRKIPDPRVFLNVPNFHKSVVKVYHDEHHH